MACHLIHSTSKVQKELRMRIGCWEEGDETIDFKTCGVESFLSLQETEIVEALL